MIRYCVLGLLLLLHTPAFGQAEPYTPAYERGFEHVVGEGRELVMVYYGASTCVHSNAEGMAEAVTRAKSLLAAQAESFGARFVAVGVAEDIDIDAGLAFLSKHGRFDEVSVGRSFLNSSSLAHTAGRPKNGGGTPQIIVFEREVAFPSGSSVTVSTPVYRAELIGSEAILRWVANGAIVP